MTQFGFLGLGIMGSAMAANLVKAGFSVTVWNRTADKCAPLRELGAQVAESPREVAAACPITFAMVADPAAAEAVCFGRDGVLAGLKPGHGYVDMSTVDDRTARRIGDAVVRQKGRFLEAPVSGTRKPAEDGTLIILAAGERGLFEEVTPAFAKLGKLAVFLGEAGQGARMKVIVNMIMGSMMTALCEGLALAEKGGIDGGELLQVLGAGALANPMFAIKGQAMLGDDFATSFPLKHMQKDLRLAVALGDDLDQSLPAVALANETFKRARANGAAEEDFCAVFKTIRDRK
jgi:3-hydroxyisobutyrate dehydrogenase-like beta-hydroxyacid dehydrogenase